MPVKQLLLQGLIGSGGQARIYKGSCEGEPVAFKYFPKPSEAAAEAAFLLRLRDPRIMKMRGLSLDPGLRGIVLEYAPGSSLRLMLNVMAEAALFPSLTAIVYLAHEIDNILQVLHRSRIMHNDLSPANILLLPDASVKLCDFGAAILRGSRAPGPAFGKRAYMALELLYGGKPSFSSDRYALAALLFELITGLHFNPTDPASSFALLGSLKNTLPALFAWIIRALAPLELLRPGWENFPTFEKEMLTEGKDEMRHWVKLAPTTMESADRLHGRVIEFVTLSSCF